MQLSTAVASLAMILATALATGHALGQDAASPVASSAPPPLKTAQKKVEEREAQRRAAAADQQKRKDYFTRRCSKPLKTPLEMEECKEMYRQM